MGEREINPMVSVIIPTYNRAHTIALAIESVLAQTYSDYEIIVVDDASEDNTEELVSGFCDYRMQYIRQDRNRGAPHARNTGAAASCGEYLAFLDSDDIWYPNYLEQQIDALDELPETVGMVCCGILRRQGESDTIMKSGMRDLTYDGHLRFGDGICTSSFVVRRAAFEAIGGFDLKYCSFQDFDFLLRISAKYRIVAIDEVLLEYRLGSDSISTNMPSKAKGLERIIHVYQSDLLRLGLMARYMFKVGQYHILAGSLTKGWKCWAQALRHKPLEAKVWKHLPLTCGGHGLYRRMLRLNSKREEQRRR